MKIHEIVLIFAVSLVSVVLLITTQERSIEYEAIWLTRILFVFLFLFQSRALFHKKTLSILLRKDILLGIILLLLFSVFSLIWLPFVFMNIILLPSILVALHFYIQFERNDTKNHYQQVELWVSVDTALLLYDCFNFLKIAALLGLISYHFLTSTELFSNLVANHFAASNFTLFPQEVGNNQWILKVLCSVAIVLWQYNNILYFPLGICYGCLVYFQYNYVVLLSTSNFLIDYIVPCFYPIVVFIVVQSVNKLTKTIENLPY